MKEKQKMVTITFEYPTHLDPRPMKLLSEAIDSLPNEVKQYIKNNPISFRSLPPPKGNEWDVAYTVPVATLKGFTYMIFIVPEIWKYDDDIATLAIYHEIAHLFLGHASKRYKWGSDRHKQIEKDAHQLAKEWFDALCKKETVTE